MEDAIQMLLQGGAFGLLSYLIFWTTKIGAPAFFARMLGIQSAFHATKSELRSVRGALEELKDEIRNHRNPPQV